MSPRCHRENIDIKECDLPESTVTALKQHNNNAGRERGGRGLRQSASMLRSKNPGNDDAAKPSNKEHTDLLVLLVAYRSQYSWDCIHVIGTERRDHTSRSGQPSTCSGVVHHILAIKIRISKQA